MSSRWRWFAKDIRSAREGEGVTMLSRVLGADPGTWGTCSAFTGRGSAGDLRLRASDFRASDLRVLAPLASGSQRLFQHSVFQHFVKSPRLGYAFRRICPGCPR